MTITPEEVAAAVREWVRLNNDPALAGALWAMEERAVGYGYRTVGARDPELWATLDFQQVTTQFWERLNYYRMEISTLKTSVASGIGLAWGVYTEEFQEKGLPPERARVRYTFTLMKEQDGWKMLLYHRDIQPFDEQRRYPRALNAVPTNN